MTHHWSLLFWGFLRRRKEIFISLTETGKTKRTSRLNTSNNPPSKQGFPSGGICHQGSQRPSGSSEHAFLRIHVSIKISRIPSCGRIWLLKLCHYHQNLKISLIRPQTPALFGSPTSHANLFSMNVPSRKFKGKIYLHTVMEPAGMNLLSFLAAWLCPHVTNKQGPDLEDTSRHSPLGQIQFLWALELVQ